MVKNINNLIKINGDTRLGTTYYYDKDNKLIYDKEENCMSLDIDFSATSMHNLGVFLDYLFEDYYNAKKSFEDSIAADKKIGGNIQWERAF